MDQEPIEVKEGMPHRWTVFRDLLIFQGKLIIDGLRDAILIPISLGAALWGVLTNAKHPGKYFYQLVHMGKKSERWINLFGVADEVPTEMPEFEVRPLDQVIEDLEKSVVDQYNRGGLTATAKQAVDNALNSLEKLRGKNPKPPDDSI